MPTLSPSQIALFGGGAVPPIPYGPDLPPPPGVAEFDPLAGPKPDLSFLAPKKGPTFGGIQITASLNETHRWKARVTKSAIESGMGVADHRIIEPFQLSMTAIITDAPIDLLDLGVNTKNSEIGKFQDRETPQQVFEHLIRMHETHAVFTVVTGFRIYNNMTFTDLAVTRDRKTGRIVSFSAEMEELQFVFTQTIPAEILAQAQATADMGDQVKNTAVNDVCIDIDRSGAAHIGDAIVEFFGGRYNVPKRNCVPGIKPPAPK